MQTAYLKNSENQRRMKPAGLINGAMSFKEYENYELLLKLYTINKTEAAATKEIKFIIEAKEINVEAVPKQEIPVLVKIKYFFSQLLAGITPPTITISE